MESVKPGSKFSDAEAEAALVALGRVLEWQRDEDGDYSLSTQLVVNGHSDRGWYSARSVKCWFFRFYIARFAGMRSYPNKRRYKSLAAARSACERHYSTGKWR